MANRSAAAALDDEPDDNLEQVGARAASETVDLPEGLSDAGNKGGDRIVGGNLDLRGPDGQNERGTVYEIVDDETPAGGQQQQAPRQDERVGEQDASGAPAIEAGRGADAQDGRQPSRKQLQRARRREGRDRTIGEVEQLRAEMATLKDQLAGVEPRLTQFDQQSHQRQVADLNRQIADATSAAVTARRQMVEASTNGDHEGMATALDARDAALQKSSQLTAQRNLMVSGSVFDDRPAADGAEPRRAAPSREQQDRQPQRQQIPVIAPAVRDNIDDFTAEFPWYNPADPNNAASQAVLAIDRGVARDGFDPAGSEYWDEMRNRMREELPTRYFDAEARPARNGGGDGRNGAQPARRQAAQPQRRGPSIGAPADAGAGQNRQQVKLTKERKESLIEMGVIANDGRTVVDKPRFMRMLKQYTDFDTANPAGRQ